MCLECSPVHVQWVSRCPVITKISCAVLSSKPTSKSLCYSTSVALLLQTSWCSDGTTIFSALISPRTLRSLCSSPLHFRALWTNLSAYFKYTLEHAMVKVHRFCNCIIVQWFRHTGVCFPRGPLCRAWVREAYTMLSCSGSRIIDIIKIACDLLSSKAITTSDTVHLLHCIGVTELLPFWSYYCLYHVLIYPKTLRNVFAPVLLQATSELHKEICLLCYKSTQEFTTIVLHWFLLCAVVRCFRARQRDHFEWLELQMRLWFSSIHFMCSECPGSLM